MTDFLLAGKVIDPARDPFASSGAHADFRFIPMSGDNRGQHIDPATRPDLLGRIFAGEGDNRRPITSYPMTSGFGPRQAPVPGASTFHKGQDYAIPMGTPLFIQGATEYYSQNGVGVAKITDAQGRPYEIELFHTDPGQFVQATSTQVASQPQGIAPDPRVSSDGMPINRSGFDKPVGKMGPFDDYRSAEERELDKFIKLQLEPSSVEDVKNALLLRKQEINSKEVQDLQRSLNQVLGALREDQTEEQRTRLALDKAAQQAAEAFQGGKSVI